MKTQLRKYIVITCFFVAILIAIGVGWNLCANSNKPNTKTLPIKSVATDDELIQLIYSDQPALALKKLLEAKQSTNATTRQAAIDAAAHKLNALRDATDPTNAMCLLMICDEVVPRINRPPDFGCQALELILASPLPEVRGSALGFFLRQPLVSECIVRVSVTHMSREQDTQVLSIFAKNIDELAQRSQAGSAAAVFRVQDAISNHEIPDPKDVLELYSLWSKHQKSP